MAVTAIWDIKGRIDKVIDYAANPDKTENKSLENISVLHAIDGVLEYAASDIKTEMKFYVSGINCDPDNASKQFMNTKRHFNKTGGIVAFHGYQSFRENEVNAEIAHEVGIKLAERLWGDRFEVVVATHLNTGHFHNHFVINSVSYKDGLKYYDQKKTYYEMRKVSDNLCKEYGLSVIKNPKNGGKNYGEWVAEKNGKPTIRGKIREQIDFAISQSTTTKHFWSAMQEMGYEINISGKYPGVKPPGAQHFFRLYKLGENYTPEAIKERIIKNVRRQMPLPEKVTQVNRCYFNGNYKKITGIYALYLHYCYKLKIIQKHPVSNKRVHFLLQQDIVKLDKIIAECSFLAKTKISTHEEIKSYKFAIESKMSVLINSRNDLRNKFKKYSRNNDEKGGEMVKGQISEISAEIKKLRFEIKLCDGISARSVLMKENLKQQRMEEINQKREAKTNEHIRRSGRPNR